MKINALFIIFIFLLPMYSKAQGNWTQKAACPGLSRHSAVAFTIGNKGYLGTGLCYMTAILEDFWEYDPANNTWTQKANFGGGKRFEAVGFSIGNYGYVGTGETNNAAYLFNDFWKYDPSTNTWVQVANFGGVKRKQAVGFAIGGKGYVGTGTNGYYMYGDFWEYNPATDTWQQVANFFPGKRKDIDRAVFVIDSKAYLGTGWDTITHFNDLWEYNSANNAWAQKANLPGVGRRGATGFSLCGYGFLGLGSMDKYDDILNDFWMYDPIANTWSQSDSFPGLKRFDQPSFIINNKAYIGSGLYTYGWGNAQSIKDLWEYSLLPLIANISANTSICIGSTASLFATGGINYLWSTGETTNAINVSPASTTTYSVTVAAFCDSKTLTSEVTVINNSHALFTYEYNPCKDNCVNFTDQSVNALTWEWDFGDGSNNSLKHSCHHYNDSADYNVSLIINKSTNCKDIALLSIPYVSHDTSAFVYIPNAFSPNADGQNDVLKFYRKDNVCVKEFKITIYDRWGEKVFETNNINDVWDGTFNGLPLNDGVYTFFCKVITLIDTYEKKGNISIIR